jgi:cytochrome oxidase assembly protein ShyY1
MPVPAGDHTIEFRFEPHSYKLGYMLNTWFSLVIYALLFAAVYMEWRKRKSQGQAKA